jgi:hypothetical protein
MAMWSTDDVVLLLKASHTAVLLASERFSKPQPHYEAMLERWEEVLLDFCDDPESGAVKSRLRESVRELSEIVW